MFFLTTTTAKSLLVAFLMQGNVAQDLSRDCCSVSPEDSRIGCTLHIYPNISRNCRPSPSVCPTKIVQQVGDHDSIVYHTHTDQSGKPVCYLIRPINLTNNTNHTNYTYEKPLLIFQTPHYLSPNNPLNSSNYQYHCVIDNTSEDNGSIMIKCFGGITVTSFGICVVAYFHYRKGDFKKILCCPRKIMVSHIAETDGDTDLETESLIGSPPVMGRLAQTSRQPVTTEEYPLGSTFELNAQEGLPVMVPPWLPVSYDDTGMTPRAHRYAPGS